MAHEAGSGGTEFLSTHPSSDSRIKDLEASIPRVLPLYETSKK
jgi:Zn-dependent protease with chaperone function